MFSLRQLFAASSALCVAGLVAGPVSAAVIVYDAGAGLSANVASAGSAPEWSYGLRATASAATTAFSPITNPTSTGNNIVGFNDPAAAGCCSGLPFIAVNNGPTQTVVNGTLNAGEIQPTPMETTSATSPPRRSRSSASPPRPPGPTPSPACGKTSTPAATSAPARASMSA